MSYSYNKNVIIRDFGWARYKIAKQEVERARFNGTLPLNESIGQQIYQMINRYYGNY